MVTLPGNNTPIHPAEAVENMFDWFRSIFRLSAQDERQQFYEMVGSLNKHIFGGKPTIIQRQLGKLPIRSHTLAFRDPQAYTHPIIPEFPGIEVVISATLKQYPGGNTTIASLSFSTNNDESIDSHRKTAEVCIDSAKLVVADAEDLEEHWTDIGKGRTGVISTAPDDTLLNTLTKRFNLKCVKVNPVRAEVVGPVSESLEKEITEYLESIPCYARHPFIHFRVQTHNSFDRVNRMEEPWGFMPIGNKDEQLMFVCQTGHGDGVYDLICGFAGNVPTVITIQFIELA